MDVGAANGLHSITHCKTLEEVSHSFCVHPLRHNSTAHVQLRPAMPVLLGAVAVTASVQIHQNAGSEPELTKRLAALPQM